MGTFPRRVVVTGLGVVCPLGIGIKPVWANLISGKIGISSSNGIFEDSELIPSKVLGRVKDGNSENEDENNNMSFYSRGLFHPNEWVDQPRRVARFSQLGMCAAIQAVEDSGIKFEEKTNVEREKIGVCFGTGFGGIIEYENSVKKYAEGNKKYRSIQPTLITKVLPNMTAGNISIKYKLYGPNHSVSTACTAGAHSIGDAMRFIKYGDADVMIAGSSEAPLNSVSIGSFARARSLSTEYNDNPQKASRPFDKNRDGFVIAEGGAALILEEYQHAKKRGAKIYAELKGYGLSCDGFHETHPPENGIGAYRSMKRALIDSKLNPNNIGYINAHATSTIIGDKAEALSIRNLFVNKNDNNNIFFKHEQDVNISSTKGSTGHLLGGAGALEAVFAIKALESGIMPFNANLDNPDFDSIGSLNVIRNNFQKNDDLKAVLSNSIGFGGTNASLVFTSLEE